MVAVSETKTRAKMYLDWVSRVVFREEKWIFNSQLNSEEFVESLRSHMEHEKFRGEIRNNVIKIFRKTDPINWLIGNKMYYFSGWIRPMPHGSRIEGKYLMTPSLRSYFSLVVGLFCLTSLVIIGIEATTIAGRFLGGATANHTELVTTMMFFFVPMIFAVVAYGLFGLFKTMIEEIDWPCLFFSRELPRTLPKTRPTKPGDIYSMTSTQELGHRRVDDLRFCDLLC